MSKIKKTVAVLIAATIILSSFPLTGLSFAKAEETLDDDYKYNTGDIIEFGSYPQSKVTDESIINRLTSKINENDWVSYGYYYGNGKEGSMVKSDYMQYVDIEYNGQKYRAVKFTKYRPYYTSFVPTDEYSSQDENGYYINTIYFFKYEPIKWRLLNPLSGYVICCKVIDSQSYNDTIYEKNGEFFGNEECTYYQNDYSKSSIRKWLNEDFYNIAFSDTEKEEIISNQGLYWDTIDKDKIQIPSQQHIQNTNNGFFSSESKADSARQKIGTDYAFCNGLRKAENGFSWWRTRVKGNSTKAAGKVLPNGTVEVERETDDTDDGIVPSMYLKKAIKPVDSTIKIEKGREYSDKDFIQYGSPLLYDCHFEYSTNNVNSYNNENTQNVTVNKVNKEAGCPTDSDYMLKIVSSKGDISPALGGFRQTVQGSAGGKYFHVFIAKIPKGYKVVPTNNSLGYGGSIKMISDLYGTGEWKLYVYEINYGLFLDEAPYGHSFGFVCLDKTEENCSDEVTWYLGYSNIFENTGSKVFSDGSFTEDNCSVTDYNNNYEQSNTVSVTRIAASADCPTTSGYMMKIQTVPGTTCPGYGGFAQRVTPEQGKVYYHKFLAKIPEGYKVEYKSCNLDGKFEWITDNVGTGNWMTYIYKVNVSPDAVQLDYFGYLALYPIDFNSGDEFTCGLSFLESQGITTKETITWYLAYSNTFENYEFYEDFKASDIKKGATSSYNGAVYIRYDYSVSWHMAKILCERMGGHLATITSSEENSAILKLFSSFSDKPRYFLGATDEQQEGKWKWVTKEPFSYSNWESGEPSNDDGVENWLILWTKDGKWNDIRRYPEKGFVCEFDKDIPVRQAEKEGHYYSLYNGSYTWAEAEEICVSMGGHLVSINSIEEQKTIEEMLPFGAMTLYWIGATDKDSEGIWKWVDTGEVFWQGQSNGSGTGYSNWSSGEPNDNESEEDYAHIYNNNVSFGKWNDIANDTSPIGFICEVDTTKLKPDCSNCYNGNKYELYNSSLTWLEAEKFAESKGGHLVTITSEKEQKFVESLIQGGTKKNYFIGANDYNHRLAWNWVTNEKWEYTNWNKDQPDFYEGREFFGMVYNRSDCFGKWNDLANQNNNVGFIIEYDDYYSNVSFNENNGNEINYLIAPTEDDGWLNNKNGTLSLVKNGVTITYDSTLETYTFDSNGATLSQSSIANNRVLFSFELPQKLIEGQYLTLSAEFVSGNVSMSSTNPCLCFEGSNIGFDGSSNSRRHEQRCATSIRLNDGVISNKESDYRAGPLSAEQINCIDTLFLWLYIPSGETVSFDNYKLKLTATITDYSIKKFDCSKLSKRIVSKNTYSDLLYLPKKGGYDFVGWTHNGKIINSDSNAVSKDAHTLTASWSLHPYTLHFNTNGGVCATESKTVCYEQPYGEMPIPTREGYLFLGWYSKKNSGIVVKPTDIFDTFSDITIYACWAKGENNSCGKNISWTLDNNKLIISGTGNMYNFEAGKAPWNSISNYVTAVEIQDGVTGIGNNAFYNMTGVKTVEIADSVNKIGESAFNSCLSLSEIHIPNNVSVIETDTFRNCISISEILFPYGVTEIKNGAFDGCNGLKKIIVYNPKCIMPEDWLSSSESTEVYGYADSTADSFADTNDLTFISIGFYGEDDGVLWIYTTSTKTLQFIANGEMPDYSGNVVPWNIVKNEIQNVIFSDKISYIGNNTLHNCTNIETIIFPNNLNDIGVNALEGTKWFDNHDAGIVVIKSILYAYKDGIEDDEVTLNKGVTRISKNFSTAFLNGISSPISLNISSSVTNIDARSLAYATNLKTLTVNAGNSNYKSIKNVIYSKDGTKLICYPAGLDGNVSIPDSVICIEPYAFAGCTELTTIEIGKGVISIADNAFDLTGLTTIKGYANSYAESYASAHGYEFVPYKSTVTFDCNDNNNTIFTKSVNTGCKIGDLYTPGQDGYKFLGWYLENEDEDFLIKSDFVVNEDITIYAYWDEVLPETPVITGISVKTIPQKTSYFVGDELDTNGIIITVNYSDNSSKEIDEGFLCFPSKLNVAGNQVVNVTYSGFNAKYNVNVEKVTPVSLTINTLPKTVQFFVGQKIETKGLVATVIYNNGTQKIVYNSTEFEYIYDFTAASDAATVNVIYQENGSEVETFYQVKVLDCPRVYADEISCVAGDNIIVPVGISGNTGLMGYIINITYDPKVMTPLAPIMQNREIYSNIETAEPGELKVIWYEKDEIAQDGELFRIPFKVSSRTAEGKYSIGITYSEENTFNENFDNVMLICSDAIVNVTEAPSRPTLYSDDINALSGSFFDVPIYIKNNVGIADASYLTIKYDPSVLTYSECINDLGVVSRVSGQATGNLKIRLDELSKNESDGRLITVRFRVNENKFGSCKLQMTIDDERWSTENVWLTIIENTSEPIISIKELRAKVGETISVPVNISNNSGLMGYKMSIVYDQSKLILRGVKNNNNWSDGEFAFNDTKGTIDIVWVSTDALKINGDMFYLLFEVRNDAAPSTSQIKVTYDRLNTFNGDYSPVEITCMNSLIEILANKPIISYNGSKTQIDYSEKYVYNISSGLNDLSEAIEAVEGYTFSLEKSGAKIGTGTKVVVKSGEVTVDNYIVILFGDVNGDGWYDGRDAVTVSMIANGMLTREQVGEAVWMAADCNHDGKIDQADVDLLNQAGLLLSSVDQTKSTEELLETSSEYNEYLNLIDQSVEVKSDEPENDEAEAPLLYNKWIDKLIDFILYVIKNIIMICIRIY